MSSKIIIYVGLLFSFSLYFVGDVLISRLEDNKLVQIFEERLPLNTCTTQNIESCLVAEGNNLSVLLIGDSHSQMFSPIFETWAKQNNHTLYEHSHLGCPWAVGVVGGWFSDRQASECAETHYMHREGLLEHVQPDIVFLVSRSYDEIDETPPIIYNDAENQQLFEDEKEAEQEYYQRIRNSIQKYGDSRVIIVESVFVSREEESPYICYTLGKTDCSFAVVKPESNNVINTLGVPVISINDIICSDVCEPIINNIVVRKDHNHLTSEMIENLTETMLERINNVLKDNG